MKRYFFISRYSLFKQLLLAIFMVSKTIPAIATTYYVDATNGNDSNNGFTPGTAWKTTSKVSGSSFNPGDFILFKRGEVFRGGFNTNSSGTSDSPITYGAYGEGEKPLLLGSVTLNTESNWSSAGTNLWASPAILPVDIGFILFNSESPANVGLKCWSLIDVNAEKKYWYDSTNKRIVLYCSQNPAKKYQSVEVARSNAMYEHFINVYRNYIKIENLAIKYVNTHGICFNSGVVGIEVRNCDISYGGGAWLRETTRYGNGVDLWRDATDCTIDGCKIGQFFDSGITLEGQSNLSTVSDIHVTNNIFWGNHMANMELAYYHNSTTLKNIYLENNISIGAGLGWANLQRTEAVMGWDLATWTSSVGSFDGFYVKNNVYYESKSFSLYHRWKTPITNFVMDYNYYFKSSGTMIDDHQNRYTMAQFSTYQNDIKRDTNSSAGNKKNAQNTARAKVKSEDIFFLNTLFQDVDEQVSGSLPTSFLLSSPANNAVINGNAVAFSWGACSGNGSDVDHYEVWIDNSHITDVSAGKTNYTSSQLTGGIHSWFVIAVCTNGAWRQSTSKFAFTMNEYTNTVIPINDNTFNSFSAYPNPTKDEILVEISDFNPAVPTQIKVVNSSGVEMINEKISSKRTSYQLEKSGLYLVSVIKENKITKTIKVIRQ